MHKSPFRARLIVLGLTFFALACFAGCGKSTRVDGTVKHKGSPVEGAVVSFVGSDGIVAGSGQTDSSGKFKLLTSYGKDQIPSGSYKVTVVKTSHGGAVNMDPHAKESASKDPSKDKDYVKQMLGAGKEAAKSQLPQQFASEKTTTLTATVPGGPFDFDLGNQ